MKVMILVGLLLIITAVSVLVWRVVRLDDQVHGLDNEVKSLRASLSERAIEDVGTFPDNIKVLTEFVSKTVRTLDIIVDVAAYGQFSNRSAFRAYQNALISIANQRRGAVRLFIYDPTMFRKITTAEFKPRFREIVSEEKYADYCRDIAVQAPQTLDKFINVLENQEHRTKDTLHRAGMTITEVGETIPVFAWLRDSSEAIISIYALGVNPVEESFRTKEPRFLIMIRNIIQTAEKSGKTYE
jgi:hypothetical protein